MGLIIKDKLQKFIVGYPTVSDKYSCAGGTLESGECYFGDLVQYGTNKQYFKPINATSTIAAVTSVAGFVLGTNVKLNLAFGGEDVKVKAGEQFNLVINGFLAVELASGAVATDIVPNASVYVTAAGKCTTSSDASKIATALSNVVYTGEYEQVGTKYIAEVYVK